MITFCFVGEWVACSVGANFTPHIITVNSGEVCLPSILHLVLKDDLSFVNGTHKRR